MNKTSTLIKKNILYGRYLRSRGFTLVETLIYIAIIGSALLSFVTFSISISNIRNKVFVVQEVQSSNRIALELVSQRVRSATGVNTGTSIFGIDPGRLSLSMADAAKDPTIIDLDADDGRLRIAEGTNPPIYLTSSRLIVPSLVFTDLTDTDERPNIRIDLTTQYNNTSGDVEFDFTQRMYTSVSTRQ